MNELLLNVVDPLHQWFLGLGDGGVLLWTVLKILLIAVPVIVTVAFYVVWERKLIGWMHVRHGPMYVGMGIFQAFADVFKQWNALWSQTTEATQRKAPKGD